VASHHFDERCGVGRAASSGLDHGSHLAEVVRAEDARGDDREHLRVNAMIVVEAVDDSARDAQHLARAYLGLSSVERPAQRALKPVDRLFVTVMTVCDRHSGCGRNVKLEEGDGTSRLLALKQESVASWPILISSLLRVILSTPALFCVAYSHLRAEVNGFADP
jgi:hypothetical protein